jgi:hypothetical protein
MNSFLSLFRSRGANLQRVAAALLAATALGSAQSLQAFDVIDPSGTIYGNVSDSSHFNGSFISANLFDADVSAAAVGSPLSAGAEYAKSGPGDAWVAFEVDQPYEVGSIFWAQRNGANTGDNMQRLSIWASETDPFTAANPGTAPLDVVNLLPNSGQPVWQEYFLTNTFTGKYFLMHLEQTDVRGNPGGAEMRLGLNPPPTAPIITSAPVEQSVYANGTARFSFKATGSIPLSYAWTHDGTAVANDARISGATNSTLVIQNVTAADAGSYSVTITNPNGNTPSDAVALTVIPQAETEVARAVMTNNPVAYYQLNEEAGATVAEDLAGTFDATYGPASGVGTEGPRPPTFPGFSTTNLALQTAVVEGAPVQTPALNLNTNAVTIVAWVKPDGSVGAQNPYTGIVYTRAGTTSAGLIYGGDGTQLGYQWNNSRYQFESGLTVPNDEWSLVAMVVTPTNATLYLGSENQLHSAVDTTPEAVQAFAGPTYIGLDTDVGGFARTFSGQIDDVAIFNHSLTQLDIQSIYAAGAGALTPTPVAIHSQPTAQSLYYGEPLILQADISGTQPISVQWHKDNAAIATGTNATYRVENATPADAGSYYFTASNITNSVTSDSVAVTVQSYSLDPLSPTGVLYTNVNADSTFSASFASSNLFTTDVSNIPIGGTLGGAEYAKKGPGDAYVAFEVDKSYEIGAVYWAQRNGSTTGDNMQVMNIWASNDAPFDTADPGRAPDAVIDLLPNTGTPVWERYVLDNSITGRYFLMLLQQTDVTGNPGGAEKRLAAKVTPSTTGSVSIALQADGKIVLSWPGNGTLEQSSSVTGGWVTATGIVKDQPFTPDGTTFYRVRF